MKTRTWIIILGICAIVLGGLGYKAQYSKATVPSNWKTYTSTEWGFQLQYPSNFSLQTESAKKTDTFVSASLVQISDPEDKGEGIPVFQVNVMRQPFNANGKVYTTSYDAAESIFAGYGTQATITKTQVSGYDAVEITFQKQTAGIGMADKEYLILKDGVAYTILWNLDHPEFSQIASSFKFTK